MEALDTESVAVRAISQARLLRHRADLAANVATCQAVALLLDAGLSQREVARLTGLSKSDVQRQSKQRPPLGIAAMKGSDTRVTDFATEWIWGSHATSRAVIDRLLSHDGSGGD